MVSVYITKEARKSKSLPGAAVTASERPEEFWWQEGWHGTEGLCCLSPAKVNISKEMGAAFPGKGSMETTLLQKLQSGHPEKR